MSSAVFPLFELADELILHIIESLEGDNATLCQLARTCRRLQVIAESLIYRHIFIRTAGQAMKLQDSLNARPSRWTAIQELDGRCKHNGQKIDPTGAMVEVFDLLPALLDGARSLREITVESPDCNYERWASRDVGRGNWGVRLSALFAPLRAAAGWTSASPAQRPLQSLSKLTLHLNGEGERYWWIKTDETACIFAQPALQELTISCAAFDYNALYGIAGVNRSALRRLTLIECHISHDLLHDLLSIPQALQYLHLGKVDALVHGR